VIDSHGRLVRRLRAPAGFKFGFDAAWSAGGLLAVELLRKSQTKGPAVLALIGNAGAGPTVLLHHEVDEGVDWSPDGRTLAWSLHGSVYFAGRFGRGRAERLMDGAGPAWSPDGTQIAAIVDGARSDDRVLIRRADGRERLIRPGWRGFEVTPDAIVRVRWAPAALGRFAFKRARAAC
jgi:Tol biopolymer transport system component